MNFKLLPVPSHQPIEALARIQKADQPSLELPQLQPFRGFQSTASITLERLTQFTVLPGGMGFVGIDAEGVLNFSRVVINGSQSSGSDQVSRSMPIKKPLPDCEKVSRIMPHKDGVYVISESGRVFLKKNN